MDKTEPKVRIRALTKAFGPTIALDGIDIAIARNRKTVIVGPAASGKTVLLKCISGIFMPTSGHAEIDGQQVTKPGSGTHTRLMRSVGVLFQQGGLFDGLPVWKNITFRLAQSDGITGHAAKEVAVDLLAKVDLPADTADLFPAELSGGMQKRVGIARALAGEPSLLLLDEPTAGLDPITTNTINRLIDESIRGSETTVLSITSDMASARHAYDDLVMLHEGRVVWQGATADIDDADNPFITQLINGRAKGPIEIETGAG